MNGSWRALMTAVLLTLGCVVATGAPPARAAATHRVSFDRYSLMVDGRRLVLWSGEFHYWRLPSPDLWRDVLEKMKAAGFNAASIYFDWGYHSPAPGVYDFSGVRDARTAGGVWRPIDEPKLLGAVALAPTGEDFTARSAGATA